MKNKLLWLKTGLISTVIFYFVIVYVFFMLGRSLGYDNRNSFMTDTYIAMFEPFDGQYIFASILFAIFIFSSLVGLLFQKNVKLRKILKKYWYIIFIAVLLILISVFF